MPVGDLYRSAIMILLFIYYFQWIFIWSADLEWHIQVDLYHWFYLGRGGIFGCYHVSLDYRPVTYEGNFITEMETWKGGGVINVYKDALKKRSLNASELKFLKIIQRRSICKWYRFKTLSCICVINEGVDRVKRRGRKVAGGGRGKEGRRREEVGGRKKGGRGW